MKHAVSGVKSPAVRYSVSTAVGSLSQRHALKKELTLPEALIEPGWKCPVEPQGFKLGGSGGSSRISVIVTRRLAASDGSSGNSGWLSALPDTAKI